MKAKHLMLTGLAIASLSSCSSETESTILDKEQQDEQIYADGIVELSGYEALSILKEPEYADYIIFSTEEEALNENLNKFAFDLFDKMSTNSYSDQSGNFSVSPISLALYLGVQANTFDETSSEKLMKALNCNSLTDYNSLSKKLMSYLPNPAIGSDMTIANSVWFNNSLQYDKNYLDEVIDAYNAEIYQLDTDSENHLQDYVNDWCNQKTRGTIKEFPADSYYAFGYLALNAVYYKGEWESKFNADKTDISDFNGTSGTKSVDMMHNTLTTKYLSTETYAATRAI